MKDQIRREMEKQRREEEERLKRAEEATRVYREVFGEEGAHVETESNRVQVGNHEKNVVLWVVRSNVYWHVHYKYCSYMSNNGRHVESFRALIQLLDSFEEVDE